MDRFMQYLGTQEGRDKTGKVIQNVALYMKWKTNGVQGADHQAWASLHGKSDSISNLMA